MGKSDLRQKAHSDGLLAMQGGFYDEAISILQNGVNQYGPHVGILSDLAGAAYLRGNMGSFQIFVERLESEFEKALPILSIESRIRTHLILGKYYEELARPTEAFEQIEIALQILPAGNPLAFEARAQKLRLLSTFGMLTEMGFWYRQCLQIDENESRLRIECGHALLLAEVRLFGFDAIWARLQETLGTPGLHAADPRLLIFDLLEIALEKKDSFNRDRLISMIATAKIENFDAYEAALLQLAQNQVSYNQTKLLEWTRKMSFLGSLRLLALALALNPEISLIREQLLYRLHSLESSDRKILLRKWESLLRSPEGILVELNQDEMTVACQEYFVSLRKSPQSWSILTALIKKYPECSPMQVCEEVFKRSATPHDLESLRINLLRLERKLSSGLQIPWLFRYGKEKITINSQIRFSP